MNILIPMAGAGSRFSDKGYTISKPLLPVTDRYSGKKVHMVIAATRDIEALSHSSSVIFIDRDFHETAGCHAAINSKIKNATFITINYLTAGQAATCMLAEKLIDNNNELFIGASDNGFDANKQRFDELKRTADVIVFTHTNDVNIERNPTGHSWLCLDADGETVTSISIKKPISDCPMNDHATTGMFWFKLGSDFVKSTKKLIEKNDREGGEYYVDKVIQYCIAEGLTVKILDVRYICWGTPEDYEEYERTIKYWSDFSFKYLAKKES